jgi:hypothetical protein
MSRTTGLAFIFASLSFALLCHAHGPQLQITNDNNQITTRNVFADEPYNTLLTDPKTAYVIPMTEGTALGGGNEYASRPFGSQGPGIAYGLGWTLTPPFTTFPIGSHFHLEFTDGLKRWNGSAFVDPGAEQLEMYRVSSNIIVASAKTTDTGPFEGIATPNIAQPTTTGQLDAHNSIRWRLLGAGGTSTEPTQDGIYLVSLQIDNSDASIAPSDPYFFVLHKNVPFNEVLAAVNATFPDPQVVQIVPEPGALGGALFVLVLALRRR